MSTVYSHLQYNLAYQLDESRVLNSIANSFQDYIQTQKDLVKEKRLSNFLKMAELKDKLDESKWNELQRAIRDNLL